MKRFAEEYLEKWISKKRRKPLVLKGARQVGKSTLVRQFALNNKLNLLEINLERTLYLNDIFKTFDTERIILELEALTGKKLINPDSLLFLDEIQATPNALQALRYLYEDFPDIPIIAAGSLLDFTLADHSFSMPVGRIEYYHLFPMSFKEFLLADEPELLEYIRMFSLDIELPEAAHRKLLQKQLEYLYTGGMPEAVSVYIESRSLTDVFEVHRSIVDTYQDDFSKYARQKDLVLMQKIFRYIPRSLGQKIKYTNISREDRSKELKGVIELLSKARICHKVYHSHASGIPLSAEINESVYKLVFLDIGLVNHICGIDWLSITGLDDIRLVNEGRLAEQFIGQHLVNINNGMGESSLNYWLRESRSANAEVDYLISRGTWILPVEVKAGKSGSLKSLQQFALQKQSKLCIRFDLNKPSLQKVEHTVRTKEGNRQVSFQLLSLPLYLVEELSRLVDDIRRVNL